MSHIFSAGKHVRAKNICRDGVGIMESDMVNTVLLNGEMGNDAG